MPTPKGYGVVGSPLQSTAGGDGAQQSQPQGQVGSCVAETHGEPGQGGPSPQHPPASPAGVVCPLRAWRRAQGGERLLAPSRDGANAGVGRSEEQQGPATARCCSLPRCQAACKLMMSVAGGEELTAEQLQERPSASLALPGQWGKGEVPWNGLEGQWGLNNPSRAAGSSWAGAAALFLLSLHQKIQGRRGPVDHCG